MFVGDLIYGRVGRGTHCTQLVLGKSNIITDGIKVYEDYIYNLKLKTFYKNII